MKPLNLWICGAKWTIQFKDHPIVEEGDKCEGICQTGERTIQVCIKDCVLDVVKQSTIHEIKHCIIATNGDRHPDEEEDCCRNEERGWLTLFTDSRNAPLIRWLMKGES
jgi:hypothetical protein